MDWFANIDLYCERSEVGFWAEPINAISNVSFILASIWALYTAYKYKALNIQNITLFILASCIGIGSFLFHTFANLWTSFADVIPIWTFVALYIVIATTRIRKKELSNIKFLSISFVTILLFCFWIIFSGSATQQEASKDIFNGSLQYLPALIGLSIFAIKTRKNKDIFKFVFLALLSFLFSLLARTLDLYLCSIVPFGTHFLWHILNGFMVAFLLQAILRIEKYYK